jgi:hypothetical protein
VTIPILKIKVIPKSVVKGKMDVRFPANVGVSSFLTAAKANGTYTFGVDYTLIGTVPINDPTTAMVVVLDETSSTYKLQSLSNLLASTAQIEQHITAAGPVTINNNTGIVRVDQTVGAAITINLPAASNKTCPVLIADWKGDGGTNNITITPNGSEKIQGQSTWTIAADTGSVFLRPISGVGYVI